MTTLFARAVDLVRTADAALREADAATDAAARRRALARRARALRALAAMPGHQPSGSIPGMGRLARAATRVVFGPIPRPRRA